jgi:hypothetical protein
MISGPFTSRILRQMAERGTLKPSHAISKDRVRWGRAGQVEGLAFGSAKPDVATESVRSAVWLDDSPDFLKSRAAEVETAESVAGVLLVN